MSKSSLEMEHIKKLKWAIWLSQVDLDLLREGEWLDLKQDLYGFLAFGASGIAATFLPEQFDSAMTRKRVAGIQSRLKEKIISFAFKEGDRSGDIHLNLTPIAVSQIYLQGFNDDRPFILFLDPPTLSKGVVSLNITNHVYCSLAYHTYASRITRPQIRICPQCQSIFLRKKRPRPDVRHYCSPRCSGLAATHAYRERGKGTIRAKERERSHQRYEAKTRRQPGHAKSKISRRPRKAREN